RPDSGTAASRSPSTATGTSSPSSTPPSPTASREPSGPPSGSSPEAPKKGRETPPVTQPGHRRHAEDTKWWHLAASRGHSRTRQKVPMTRENTQRRRAELNRCTGFSRPSREGMRRHLETDDQHVRVAR